MSSESIPAAVADDFHSPLNPAAPIPFLVGCVRSGTTLLRLMLSHHPQLAWSSEFEMSVDFMPAEGGFPSLDDYYAWLDRHWIFKRVGHKIDPSLTYPELVRSFLEQWRLGRGKGKPMIGATCHRHFHRLLEIWPEAKFIHLKRDGRDVTRSVIEMGWAGNVWTASNRWITAERSWLTLKEKVPADRLIELSHEDLIADPPYQLARLTEFIGIPYSPAMLEYHSGTTYGKPDPKLTQQWRRKLSDRQIQLIECRMGDMLVERGYELSGLPRIKAPLMADQWYELVNRLGIAGFRRRRYGWGLWLKSVLTRRLAEEWHQRRVQPRIDAIDATHLK